MVIRDEHLAHVWPLQRRHVVPNGIYFVNRTMPAFILPDPVEYLPEQMPNRDRRFLALMEVAGYRLAAIDTDEGLFGRVRYHFEQQRAPSSGDLERIRRGLVEHRAHHSGAIASAQRRALLALLMVGDAPDFQVAAVNIDLRPWPKVSFHLTARDPIMRSAP